MRARAPAAVAAAAAAAAGWAIVAVCAAVAREGALAGPMDPAGGSPRAVGRAGTSAVADDGAGALLINPAGLARRGSWRLQLGSSFSDEGMAFSGASGPVARDQGGSSLLPMVAVMGAVGDWLVGASVATVGAMERRLRDPADVSVMSIRAGKAFEYRYAGIEGGYRRDAFTVGVARQLGDSVAVGVSGGVSRIAAFETRRMWVGFENALNVPIGDASRDLQVSLEGDALVPHATLGALIAPVDTPLELGLSIGWVKRPTVTGSLTGSGVMGGPALRLTDARAQLIVRQPIAVHAGARYVGDRLTVELGGDLWLASAKAERVAWELEGVRVANSSTPNDFSTALAGVPSRYSLRTHGAIRASADVEILPGFLWLTGGYAFTVGGTRESRMSPTFGDLGGHTLALGVEATKGGVTYTLGWSRTVAIANRKDSVLRYDNPFAAGDGALPTARYDSATDVVGVMLDFELAAP